MYGGVRRGVEGESCLVSTGKMLHFLGLTLIITSDSYYYYYLIGETIATL